MSYIRLLIVPLQFAALDLLIYSALVAIHAASVRGVAVSSSLGVGLFAAAWRIIYLQAVLQMSILIGLNYFRLMNSFSLCLIVSLLTFLFSSSMTVGVIPSLHLLLPVFERGGYREGFVILISTALSWICLKALRIF
jgi:hypothetical protein